MENPLGSRQVLSEVKDSISFGEEISETVKDQVLPTIPEKVLQEQDYIGNFKTIQEINSSSMPSTENNMRIKSFQRGSSFSRSDNTLKG